MKIRLGIWLPVLVIAVVLVGGYLVSNALRNSGGDGGTTAAAQKTAAGEETQGAVTAARSTTPRPTRTPTTRSATTAAGAAYDLEADEQRGGHTLSRHVGKSDAELKARLARETEISAASTYTDQDAAELTVGQALAKNRAKVTSWEKRSGERPNLALRFTSSAVIGRSLERGARQAADTKKAVVVLKWTGRDWFVLTSYPEAP